MTETPKPDDALVERLDRALAIDAPTASDLEWSELLAVAIDARHRIEALSRHRAGDDLLREALEKIAAGRTIRFTGSEHHGKPLRDKDAQQIAVNALAHLKGPDHAG